MQTAVEWLYNEIEQRLPNFIEAYKDEFEQSFKMEKQQIMDTWKEGINNGEIGRYKDAQEYYNETYGSKGSDDEFDVEKEMFELEQQLDIPSHMRWHNRTSSQTEISDGAKDTADWVDRHIIESLKELAKDMNKQPMTFVPEISNEEIAINFAEWIRINDFQTACGDKWIGLELRYYTTKELYDKWYREQLKNKP